MSDEQNNGYVSLKSMQKMLKNCENHIQISFYDATKILELIID
jgi:hypothetical protein